MIAVVVHPWCPDLDKIRQDLDLCQTTSFVSGIGWFESRSEDEYDQNEQYDAFDYRYNRYLSFLGLLILEEAGQPY